MASAWSVSRFFYAGMYVGGQRDSLSPNFPFSPSGKRLLQVPSKNKPHISFVIVTFSAACKSITDEIPLTDYSVDLPCLKQALFEQRTPRIFC
jgi:hypothetical protein|tara:strand:- start:3669 stop:3947 length:279 start_codon:yes stop_codon:yes gene_type:complete